MLEKTYMYLSIRGEFDPIHVIDQISLKPWEHHKMHSRSVDRQLPRCSIVSYAKIEVESECPDLYDMSDALYTQLKPYEDQFIALAQDTSLDFICSTCLWMVHDLSISTPPIGFNSDFIRFLGLLGASIDVDTYRDDEYKPNQMQNKSQ